MEPIKVIITDAHDRKALASVRNLAKAGVRVCVAGRKPTDHALFSKYASGTVLYPNPADDAGAFAGFMLDFVRREKFDCILPLSDYTTIPLSRHKAEFAGHVGVALPDYDTLQFVRNKPEILKLAERIGIGVPRTHCPSSEDEAREVSKRMRYPCVVKYKKGTGAIGIRYPENPEELLDFFENMRHAEDVVFDDVIPMVQEYVPGGIIDVCLLMNEGTPRAAEVHERTKMYPPTGGYGVAYETVDEPVIKEQAIALMSKVGWHGPCMVEFKMDTRDGVPKLMEVNTRFWGGVDVSAKAGIDFVHLAAKMAAEGDVEEEWDYRVGMKYRWLFPMELKSAWRSEHRLEALLDYFRFERGVECDLSLSDPLPHIMKGAVAIYGAAHRYAGWILPGGRRT